MEDTPNPRMKIGAPQPGSSLEELKAWAAYQGTVHSSLVDIGHYYSHEAPGDRENEIRRSRGRDR